MSIKKLVSQIEAQIRKGKELEAKLLESHQKLNTLLVEWAQEKDDPTKTLTTLFVNEGTKRKPLMLERRGITYNETWRDADNGNSIVIERSKPVYFEEDGWEYNELRRLYQYLRNQKDVIIKKGNS